MSVTTGYLIQEATFEEVLASPRCSVTGIMMHPAMPHHYVLMMLDQNHKPIGHRIIDAADLIRHASNVLAIVDECSVDQLSQLVQLTQKPGAQN